MLARRRFFDIIKERRRARFKALAGRVPSVTEKSETGLSGLIIQDAGSLLWDRQASALIIFCAE